jgi:hypothetical protein
MADLLDRIQGNDTAEAAGRPKIPLEQFMAALGEYARSHFTRQQISTAFDLQGDEVTQAGLLADAIDSKTGAANKAVYVLEIRDVLALAETPELGAYTTNATIKTRLGL